MARDWLGRPVSLCEPFDFASNSGCRIFPWCLAKLMPACMLLTGLWPRNSFCSGDDDSSDSESQDYGNDPPHVLVQIEVLADDVLRLHLLLTEELLSAEADCRLSVPVPAV